MLHFKAQAQLDDRCKTELFERFIKENIVVLDVCDKIEIGGVTFKSYSKTTKFCNSCFIDEGRNIGLIDTFIIFKSKAYALARKLHLYGFPFFL